MNAAGATTARLLDSLATIAPAQWDALHDGRNPFLAHAFLHGLERHGCLRPDWGWTPHHLTLWRDEELVAAVPAYLKQNSHGEFVFDHAWAQAYAQHGLDYFPKWLAAVPYSPVTGPRLLARDEADRRLLPAALAQLCERQGLSSVHVNFHRDDEDASFAGDGDWLQRIDVQYHWHNPADAQGRRWRDFDGFLAAFDHKHRKNIRQERAKVARAGVTYRVVDGHSASDDDLATMHRFYRNTFAEYGNHPALTLEFLRHLARELPQALVIFLAQRDGAAIAGALCLRGGDTLYGRYWGAELNLPGLHFETCYYQGIDYCLREGLHRFEPGAQGEHKIARGFLPTEVRSRHWLAHPGFGRALREWCRDEAASVRRYAATLAAHSPFKQVDGAEPTR
ncbi:GNAT family N-acetyltransferase [Lysobacter sp. BMK333-48F3]|uniref:GNAT family N-acetyltransferase n=1 Tax=Lysobacter sp. BMK333-48F3 TaxID=2867962 RepID=UPI001C8B7E9E|nr:GNAT family N-acetyltransferase [Lysobacter sp. BMK333-48F3]MBX9403118.1 GNAT family N-acetyltransferase [Lysobacter sp. BMK333-48F3]